MTIDQNLRNYKHKVFRKVTIGRNTISLNAFGIEGATFTPIVYDIIRDNGIYSISEGRFKTKVEAVAFFKELVNQLREWDRVSQELQKLKGGQK